ncbi:hypothetical protein ACH3XW_45070 [Acanthocheilonema viteae]
MSFNIGTATIIDGEAAMTALSSSPSLLALAHKLSNPDCIMMSVGACEGYIHRFRPIKKINRAMDKR